MQRSTFVVGILLGIFLTLIGVAVVLVGNHIGEQSAAQLPPAWTHPAPATPPAVPIQPPVTLPQRRTEPRRMVIPPAPTFAPEPLPAAPLLPAPARRSPQVNVYTAAPASPIQPAPPLPLGGRTFAVPPAPLPAGPAQRPASPDNRDFDRYLQWVRRVEGLRAGLRVERKKWSGVFYETRLGLADPNSDDVRTQQRIDIGIERRLRGIAQSITHEWRALVGIKPSVPPDCQAFDSHYAQAIGLEIEKTTLFLEAVARRDFNQAKTASERSFRQINHNLGRANLKLREACQGRSIQQSFEIQVGES